MSVYCNPLLCPRELQMEGSRVSEVCYDASACDGTARNESQSCRQDEQNDVHLLLLAVAGRPRAARNQQVEAPHQRFRSKKKKKKQTNKEAGGLHLKQVWCGDS